MSDLTTARQILQGETLTPPRGNAWCPELIEDYVWYSLDDIIEKYRDNACKISDNSARIAYNQAVATAQNILRAQGGTHYSDEGRKAPAEHLTLKVGDHVTWDGRFGKIRELDSFGWAFITMRIRIPNQPLGHQVSIRVKRNLLEKITLD